MLDVYWFIYSMQTKITLIGGPYYLIWYFSGKAHPSMFSACAFLY